MNTKELHKRIKELEQENGKQIEKNNAEIAKLMKKIGVLENRN